MMKIEPINNVSVKMIKRGEHDVNAKHSNDKSGARKVRKST